MPETDDAIAAIFGDLDGAEEFFPGSKRKRSQPVAAPPAPSDAPAGWDARPTKVLKYPGVDFFTIGQLALALNRQPVTIRSWEAKGLLPPARFRKASRRLYTRRQVEGLVDICAQLGVLDFHVRPDRIPSEKFRAMVNQLWKEPVS